MWTNPANLSANEDHYSYFPRLCAYLQRAMLGYRDRCAAVRACLTGGLLGLSGFAMIHWQGSAARRGARSAQRDLF